MNNDMNNFAYQTSGSVNLVRPGKWPRSTMADDRAEGREAGAGDRVAGGATDPGDDPAGVAGRAEVRAELGRRGAGAAVSSAAGDGGRPNEIDLETGSPPRLGEELERMGWRTFPRTNAGDFYFGSVNAVRFLPDGEKVGVADQRRTNDAGGD